MDGYSVNLVDTEAAGAPDAITEIWTASSADFFDPAKSFATPDDAQELMTDHDSFIGPYDTYIVEERVVRQGSDAVRGREAGVVLPRGRRGTGGRTGRHRCVEHRVVQALGDDAPALHDDRVHVGAVAGRARAAERGELRRARVPQEAPRLTRLRLRARIPGLSDAIFAASSGSAAATFASRSRSSRCSAAVSTANADGGSASSSSAALAARPSLGVSTMVLTRRSVGCGRRSARPRSSRPSARLVT